MFEGSLAKKVRPIDSRRASTAGPASGIPGAGRASPQTGMVSSRSVSGLVGYRGHPVLVIWQRRRARPPPDADGDGEFLCRVGRPEKLGAFRRTSFAAGKTPIICRDLSHV